LGPDSQQEHGKIFNAKDWEDQDRSAATEQAQ
jgi:hypothetical protein